MEPKQLDSKCGDDVGEPRCQEFTVSATGGAPTVGLVLVAALIGSSAANYDSLSRWTARPRDVLLLAVLALALLAYVVNYLATVRRESVLLVTPLGLQLSTARRTGRPAITWIPWGRIGNFMILDVITRQKVIFCLAVSVKQPAGDREKTLILFRNTRPRLQLLETIYRQLQTSLDTYRS